MIKAKTLQFSSVITNSANFIKI